MERTIRVTGKGRVSVKPDRIRLYFTQENTRWGYAEAVQESTVKKGELNEAFEKLGFSKGDDTVTIVWKIA